ncbi:hypothetical protein [Bacillus phage PK16]|nr:hypothetical protein [Bacillus phage PK16]
MKVFIIIAIVLLILWIGGDNIN